MSSRHFYGTSTAQTQMTNCRRCGASVRGGGSIVFTNEESLHIKWHEELDRMLGGAAKAKVGESHAETEG